MQCPSCQHENRDTAKFCDECATALPLRCVACGAELRPTAKFCDECSAPVAPPAAVPERDPRAYTPKHLAEKILTSRFALEGEHKQVTVLFADVKGSMELAEQVDPEEWHRILDRFFRILADGIHRFEGTINQYTGDGIMALFGAPIAHEDHAQRACYAALHLTDALRRYGQELKREKGLSFSTRLGLNSGDVVVGKIGDDLRMDYTAQGHTVGLASRMQELAEPGTAYLSEHTGALVTGYFDLEDLGSFRVKGIEAPLRVHQLRGVGPHRTRLEVSRARGLSCFVGRERETAALEAALEQALQGQGQVVGVVAEAGVGKSRLCFEFAERCRRRGLLLREAHCVAHGKMIPLLPILELTRAYFGITDQDTDEAARDKIAGRVVRLDPEVASDLPLLLEFAGVPDPQNPAPKMPPETQRKRLFAMVRKLIRARSEREPGIVIVEDLHWIDPASEVFLENWVESILGTRTLFLVNFRPEYHAEWMQKSYYQQLALLPLGKRAIEELLGDLLGQDPSLGDLLEQIQPRTGGNPFFIEELVRSLVESEALVGRRGAYQLARPVDEVAIPPTVQAVLAARIDRLAEREKHLLQTASVIGKTFSDSLLGRVVEFPETERSEAVRILLSTEFLYEEALYPEAEYTFKHPLTQEVTYASQLGERRRRLHGAVARAIEELHPERLDERAALLAHHWQEAGELLDAARWHRRAALWATIRHSPDVPRHWDRVRRLLESVPESKETLALRVEACGQLIISAGRLGGSEPEVDALLREARLLAAKSEDRRTLALLTIHYAYFQTVGGQLSTAQAALEEARRLMEKVPEPELEMAFLYASTWLHLVGGSVREMFPEIEHALSLGESNPELGTASFGFGVRSVFFVARAYALAASGRLEESRMDLERATALARETNPSVLVGVAMAYAFCGELFDDPAAVFARAREAIQVASEVEFGQALARLALGQAFLLNGQAAEAVDVLEQGLAATRESLSYRYQEADFLLVLARAHLAQGNLERARAAAEEANVLSTGRGFLHADVQLARARIEMRVRGREAEREVEAVLAEAQRLIDASGASSRQPFIHEVRGELAGYTGDPARRERELREAHRLFTEMGATGHAERVGRELTGA